MSRKSGLIYQVDQLNTAVELCDGRVSEQACHQARETISRIDQRTAFSGNATVVALAGATGSGKSSLFNALSGTDLAKPGIRRPTTSQALAAAWVADDAASQDTSALLDWLDIAQRAEIREPKSGLSGLVLLDLPDHDSTEMSHRMEVDRLVQLVDMFIWVLDPQKYADAALHEQYLQPLAQHAEVMLIVLNQADRLDAAQGERLMRDLRKLLNDEGLSQAKLLAASAVTGQGVQDIQAQLVAAMKTKKAASQRLQSDLIKAAQGLSAETGSSDLTKIGKKEIQPLIAELAHAAGVETVQEAVLRSWRHRGSIATGWPLVSWLSALRIDPLRRLHLDQFAKVTKDKELEPVAEQRTSLPAIGGVGQARIDHALRLMLTAASQDLPRGWADAVVAAGKQNSKTLPDELDRAIGQADLGMESGREWWLIVTIMQWLLIITVIIGVAWLAINPIFSSVGIPPAQPPRWQGVPIPTWLLLGGVGCGVALALVSRVLIEWGARAKAHAAGRKVRFEVAGVCDREIVKPMRAELARLQQAREALGSIH